MQEWCWIEGWLKRVNRKYFIIFKWVFLVSFLVHAFVMTNNLANYDSMFYFYGDQNTTSSGRWFLQYAGGISSYFQLPMLNGILSILYISISAVIMVKMLEVNNVFLGVLLGITLAVYPTVANIFNFMYAADAYFLALLLAVFAADLMVRKKWYLHVLGGGVSRNGGGDISNISICDTASFAVMDFKIYHDI